MPKKNIQKTKSIKKDSGIKSAREKMIGQHIGYRYDVNLLPDYKKLTPFLKKYIVFYQKNISLVESACCY